MSQKLLQKCNKPITKLSFGFLKAKKLNNSSVVPSLHPVFCVFALSMLLLFGKVLIFKYIALSWWLFLLLITIFFFLSRIIGIIKDYRLAANPYCSRLCGNSATWKCRILYLKVSVIFFYTWKCPSFMLFSPAFFSWYCKKPQFSG